jgi:hypothetical protein
MSALSLLLDDTGNDDNDTVFARRVRVLASRLIRLSQVGARDSPDARPQKRRPGMANKILKNDR